MTEWHEVTTADLIKQGVLEIGDGYRAKNAEFAPNGGLPFVRVGDVGPTLRLHGIDELPSETRSKYEPKVSRPGDSLITMKGTVGRVAFVPDDTRPFVYSPQISYWRSHDHTVVLPRWLRYWLEGPEFASQASATKGATDMADYINLRDQRRMKVTLPPLATQHRLAEVLGSIDDLIEANRRQVELLEEMAQAIYREWFVRFRYPGHEDVPLMNSLLGPIPNGWTIQSVGDLAVIDKGLSYKGAHLADTGTPMANLKCLRPGGGFRRDGTKPYDGPFKVRHQIAAGDLVMANTDLTQAGSVIGSPAFVPRGGFERGGIASHHLFIVRPAEKAARHWLYESFRDKRFRSYARGVASGTTVLGFRPLDLATYPVPVPPLELMQRFDGLATGFTALQEDLTELGEVLAASRYLLLPKLVTGRIGVSQIDDHAQGEAASA